MIARFVRRSVLSGVLLAAASMAAFLVPGTATLAQTANVCDPGESPDVVVAELFDKNRYGTVGDITAFSIATRSCNIGTCWLNWVQSTNRHPVIAQNMYRLKNGRLEQIGQSWLKHGFFALSETYCSTSCIGTDGSHLGVNCSDPYSAGLNGQQDRLGPRYVVNATTGDFPYPPPLLGATGDAIFKRLQVHNADLDPALNAGAQYLVEGQYVTQDDALSGNGYNNTSSRFVNVTGSGGVFDFTLTGPTYVSESAIERMKSIIPGFRLSNGFVPGEQARFIMGATATSLGGGMYRYEYALYNQNSHRSAGKFIVPIPKGATVANVGFHDVDYHSGEPFDGTDWPAAVDTATSSLVWETTPYATNENANALRWGTLYNFRFDMNVAPIVAPLTIGLFRPGTPAQMDIPNTWVPNPCNNDGVCDPRETCTNCASDCLNQGGAGGCCGDGTCNPGEDTCSCAADCGLPAAFENFCADGEDDDCDGQTDCADFDCCTDTACAGADADGDTFATCDCDDGNGSVWATPGEARDLVVEQVGGTTELHWTVPAQLGGSAVTYDTLRSPDPADFVAPAVCILAPDPAVPFNEDPGAPPGGGLWAYLVRARNQCPAGQGTLGTKSDGSPRTGRTCPGSPRSKATPRPGPAARPRPPVWRPGSASRYIGALRNFRVQKASFRQICVASGCRPAARLVFRETSSPPYGSSWSDVMVTARVTRNGFLQALVFGACLVAGAMAPGAAVRAQDANLCDQPGESPDVIVGEIYDKNRYGSVGDITAFSIATRSCNVGTCWLNWIQSTNEHPVIGQTMYRLKNGRMEQIGQSWLKHGFFALSEQYCHNDCVGTDGSHLGVHCSDPYNAGLNGQQNRLGPKHVVNATTGAFPYPPPMLGATGDAIFKRLQVHNADLDPALNPGAQYMVEAQYVTADDSAAGNGFNNTSTRFVNVTANAGAYDFNLTGSTFQGKSAVQMWRVLEPGVAIASAFVPDEQSRFLVGSRATSLGGGMWHYEYAVYNQNSHRSAGSFIVPLPRGATVSNVGFHDVDYHSGEPYDGTDWPASIEAATSSLVWATTPYAANENANALRWGTTYNFRFDANVAPLIASAEMGLFRPGSPATMTVANVYVPDPCNNDGVCDPRETCGNCPSDCLNQGGGGGCCGDGTCGPGESHCVCAADCGVPSAFEAACADGTDDDCDGQTDCSDFDCCTDGACAGADQDGDSFATCDCDDGNGAVWATPGEARDLVVERAGGTTELHWTAPAQIGGVSVTFDTLRTPDASDFVGAAVCVLAPDPSLPENVDADDPPADGAFYYLVRARNQCPAGQGSLGTRSDGGARGGRICP